MDQEPDLTSETDQEAQPITALTTEKLIKAELPTDLQEFSEDNYFTAEWKRKRRDIDHEKATTIDANNRVAYVMRDYTKRKMTGLELTVGFREDFEFWKVKSFNLISDEIRRVFREFLITRGVHIDVRRGLKIPVALVRAVEEDDGAEERLAQRRIAEIEAVELMEMEEVKQFQKSATLRRSEALSPQLTRHLSPAVARRARVTTTPQGEPITNALTRQVIQQSPIDVSMVDAEYIQASTRDVEMIDAPASQRRTADVRYYGGTEYRDPPADILSSSAGESSRRSVLISRIEDSQFVDTQEDQRRISPKQSHATTNVARPRHDVEEEESTHQQQVLTSHNEQYQQRHHGARQQVIRQVTNDEQEQEGTHRSHQTANETRTRRVPDHTRHIQAHATRPAVNDEMQQGKQEIQMPIRTALRPARQRMDHNVYQRPEDTHTYATRRQGDIDVNYQPHVRHQQDLSHEKYSNDVADTEYPAHRRYDDAGFSGAEIRRMNLDIKKAFRTEEKYSGAQYNFLTPVVKSIMSMNSQNIDIRLKR
ncbi:hypothetical protein E4U22_003230 [Claviceps purpurea]|nr:hypothetical protein E4U22_003230 [Claviceps purpurea]